MRDTSNGDFEIYDIANNTITDAMVAGIAADPRRGLHPQSLLGPETGQYLPLLRNVRATISPN